jgi:hypothetical protein
MNIIESLYIYCTHTHIYIYIMYVYIYIYISPLPQGLQNRGHVTSCKICRGYMCCKKTSRCSVRPRGHLLFCKGHVAIFLFLFVFWLKKNTHTLLEPSEPQTTFLVLCGGGKHFIFQLLRPVQTPLNLFEHTYNQCKIWQRDNPTCFSQQNQ